MNRSSLTRLAGWLAFGCIATILLMFARPQFTNASQPQHGIGDPVLALQMAESLADVDAVLSDSPSPDREVMRLKQYEDFAFIAFYAALYTVMSILLARTYPRFRIIAIIAAICGLAAAALDITENLAILRVTNATLAQTTQPMIDAIRRVSIPKWALGFIALGLLANYFWLDRRKIVRAVGVIDFAACFIGLYSLFDHSVLIYAVALIFLGLIGTTAVFLLLPPLLTWKRHESAP